MVTSRTLVPCTAAAALIAALVVALSGARLPPADFTFCNGTEVKSLDPLIVTGQPENNMVNCLFEGLVRWNPETLEPEPGVAERWEISADRLTYTYHLRESARWSNGDPVTADDFRYALRRILDPRTAAQYAYQAFYIKNARRYTGGGRAVRPGDRVEVELNLGVDAINTRRGEVLRGKLVRIEDASGEPLDGEALAAAANDPNLKIESWRFVVAIDGRERGFRYADDAAAARAPSKGPDQWCRQVLIDFRDVGVEAVDARTLRHTLENPTPFFLNLLGFYPLFPVHRECVEAHGSPQWTDPANIVCNGAFVPQFRRIRDRTRLVKNHHYWDRKNVRLDTVDVLAVESVTTALNLYLTGKSDWIYDVPATALRALLNERPRRPDVNPHPLLNTYFYLINTTRKPLDDPRVRRALSLALDRSEITRTFLGNGEREAYSIVPPGLPGYEPPETAHADDATANVAEARALLAAAGYPGGRGFPTFTILYNTHEMHQSIAQLIRKQWQRNLGISVRGRNEEFVTSLDSQRNLKYDISRRGWVGDYADPNT
ncbi:MAG TPA: peptide ABC transporter substrate-binding protein, partial [Lacipirellulaceae bacterium]|nr:peptide ABC transporter substrate-binding protein [Lacipirellulaceae bacterium]